MLCTVNDIRKRLGTMMKPILTDEFDAKYQSVHPSDPIALGFEYDAETDRFVKTISEHVHDESFVNEMVKSAKPEVVFTFFLRYHTLTTALCSRNQNLPANVPEKDEQFFEVLLTQLWKAV